MYLAFSSRKKRKFVTPFKKCSGNKHFIDAASIFKFSKYL